MHIPNFSIPLNREELIKVPDDGQFYVKHLFSASELHQRLEAAGAALSEEGPFFIVDHFPTFFSSLQQFKQISDLNQQKGWYIMSKALTQFSSYLRVVLEDVKNLDSQVKNDVRNLTKMIFYLLSELMSLLQDKCVESNNTVISLKGKRKQKSLHEWDWNEEKLKALNEIHSIVQLPIKLLWDPPVLEEEFVNLIANIGMKCLEDKNIHNQSMTNIREIVFCIFGMLINKHLFGLSFCVKVVQLLKTNENLVSTLAKGVVQLVQRDECHTIVTEIVREITDTDDNNLIADTSGTRALHQFIVMVAELTPSVMLPAVDFLLPLLQGNSYIMRTCVLDVLGLIIIHHLSKENLCEQMKHKRNKLLRYLMDHVDDVNAYVRAKALQVWMKLNEANAIPLSELELLLTKIICRLKDKTSSVRKYAIAGLSHIVRRNPYAAQLSVTEIKSQLAEEAEKLESMKKTYKISLPDLDTLWIQMEPKLKEILESVSENSENLTLDDADLNLELKIDEIGNLLLNSEYEIAVKELLLLKDKCHNAFNIGENDDIPLIDILRNIFHEKRRMMLINVPTEVQEKLDKSKLAIEYLENALKFANLIDTSLPITLTLLNSNTVSDVLESIDFFTTSYLFGFHQALEGVRRMLYLMYSKDEAVRSAVSSSYNNLYFKKDMKGRQHSLATIKSLSDLILTLNESQLNALEIVVRDWHRGGLIDSNFIQVLYERFSKKIPGTSEEYSWAALVLLRMIGAEEPRIIKSNISVLLSQGLGDAEKQNFLTAKETCRAFLRLIPEKQHGKPTDETLRYPPDHEIFFVLHKFTRDALWRTDDPCYIPFAEEAINLVFRLCDKPDSFCERLIVEIQNRLTNDINPLNASKKKSEKILMKTKRIDELMPEEPVDLKTDKKEENTDDTDEDRFTYENILLARFIAILGQAAANYVLFLEGPVLNELKRRNQLDLERKFKKFQDRRSRIVKNKKNVRNSADDTFNKPEQEVGDEDLEFNRVAADDIDAEEMKNKTENEIVTGNGYFAKFVPLILTVCKNPGRYTNASLQNATLLTLSKFMHVSSAFCEEHLQLLVTICEKSHSSERRKNAIIALGALQYRFPNTLEPWTSHMYGMLKDSDSTVRLSAVMILTDLIVNEMIKVRTNISDLAICIVDEDVAIAKMVRHFFKEYSTKGNALFNVLPSLISNLLKPNTELTQEEFKTIMKFILGLFSKEKQSEYLIDKLFQYFESASTERQWSDLAYCLSLLNYNEKALKKILENVRYFGNKLYLSDVYEAFCVIVETAARNLQKDKNVLQEVQDLIKECRDQCCQGKSVISSVRMKKSCVKSTSKRTAIKKIPSSVSKEEESVIKTRSMRCKRRIKYDDSSEENLERNDDDESENFLSDSSTRRCLKVRNPNIKKLGDTQPETVDEFDVDSGEKPRKQLKKMKNNSTVKKLKSRYKYSDGTSEEEEKKDTVLRSTRKKK